MRISDWSSDVCSSDLWSPFMVQRHSGAPLKHVVAHWRDPQGREHARQGECVVSEAGIEGSLVYALSAGLREAIARDGSATRMFDLAPERTPIGRAPCRERVCQYV